MGGGSDVMAIMKWVHNIMARNGCIIGYTSEAG